MNQLHLMAHKLDVRARSLAEAASDALRTKRENGQGTIEYVGIIVVISIIIAALIAFFKGSGQQQMVDGINRIIQSIFSNAK